MQLSQGGYTPQSPICQNVVTVLYVSWIFQLVKLCHIDKEYELNVSLTRVTMGLNGMRKHKV